MSEQDKKIGVYIEIGSNLKEVIISVLNQSTDIDEINSFVAMLNLQGIVKTTIKSSTE